METEQDSKIETSALVVWQQNEGDAGTPREQLEQLGEAIAELSAHIDAATFRLLRMISRMRETAGRHVRRHPGICWWCTWTRRCWQTGKRRGARMWSRVQTFPRARRCFIPEAPEGSRGPVRVSAPGL